MRQRRWVRLVAFAVVTLGLGLHVAADLSISSRLTSFLATEEDHEIARIALGLADSERTRTLILGIRAPDARVAVRAAREWSDALVARPEIETIRYGPRPELAELAIQIYGPRRFLFLSDRPEVELPARLSDEGLRSAARTLRTALAGPEGPMIAAQAAGDPLLALRDQMHRLERAAGESLRVVEGGFVAGEPERAIVFLTTRHSAFASAHQTPLLAHLDASFAALNQRHGGVLRLERSGAHVFASASEARARADAARLSSVSLVALALVFLWVFRSLRVLFLTFLPLLFGMLAATSATLALSGELHALTLAFGSALIGICTDYPLHVVSHWVLGDERDPRRIAYLLRTPIALAAGTSTAGFLAIGTSELPGIREIGIFAAIGVASAAAVTMLVVPDLMPHRPTRTAAQTTMIAWLRHWILDARVARPAGAAVVMAALVICGAGLPQIRWNDDLFSLNAPLDAEQLREARDLQSAVGGVELRRIAIAMGTDDESALLIGESLQERLDLARETGAVGDIRSVHPFLWSREMQQRNWQTLSSAPDLADRLRVSFASEGFRADAFAPFTRQLRAPAPAPLTFDEVLASPLHDAVAPFRLLLDGGRVALFTFLRDVHDPAAIEAAIEEVPGARYFDQQRFATRINERARTRSMRLVAIGWLGVVLLLALRYRRAGPTLVAAAPPGIAALTTIALLALTGTQISILHLLGLLLVLSLGIDYGIFIVESRPGVADENATLLSVTLDCASTILSFGLLAASSFPALQALGIATGIGTTLSLLLAFGIRGLLDSRGTTARDNP